VSEERINPKLLPAISRLPYTKSPQSHHDPQSHFLPIEGRRRLKEIVLKSQNPQKSLDYFRSKVFDFQSRSIKLEQFLVPPTKIHAHRLSPHPQIDGNSQHHIHIPDPEPVVAAESLMAPSTLDTGSDRGDSIPAAAAKGAREPTITQEQVPLDDGLRSPRQDPSGKDPIPLQKKSSFAQFDGDRKIVRIIAMYPVGRHIRIQFIRFFEGGNHRIKSPIGKATKSNSDHKCVHHQKEKRAIRTTSIPLIYSGGNKDQQKEASRLDGQATNNSVLNTAAVLARGKLTEYSNARLHVRVSPIKSEPVTPTVVAGNSNAREENNLENEENVQRNIDGVRALRRQKTKKASMDGHDVLSAGEAADRTGGSAAPILVQGSGALLNGKGEHKLQNKRKSRHTVSDTES
jgi:hypothetical protein